MTKTYHKEDCKRVFKNYDHSCPRCVELINGAEARKGWKIERPVYAWKPCGHGAHNLNPGGYCNICGNGRDHS